MSSRNVLIGITVLATSLMVCSGFCAELKDPMRPYSATKRRASAPTAAPLKVSAIIHSEQRRVAVLNGKTYRLGDRIRGYEIVAIEPWAVTIKREQISRELRLNKPTKAEPENAREGEQTDDPQ